MQLSLCRDLGVTTKNFAKKRRSAGFLFCHPNDSFPFYFSPAHVFLATWIVCHYDPTHHHPSAFSRYPEFSVYSPDPMNQIFMDQPRRCTLWELVPNWYKIIPPCHFGRSDYRIILRGGSDPEASDSLHKILYVCTER